MYSSFFSPPQSRGWGVCTGCWKLSRIFLLVVLGIYGSLKVRRCNEVKTEVKLIPQITELCCEIRHFDLWTFYFSYEIAFPCMFDFSLAVFLLLICLFHLPILSYALSQFYRILFALVLFCIKYRTVLLEKIKIY